MNRVEILAVGNELLAGDITDTNFLALARVLKDKGAVVTRHVTLPDDRAVIADGVRDALARADLVLVTGGLGPTEDDLTRFGVADGLGRPLVRDAGAVETIRARFRRYGVGDMPVANLVQADFPEGARLLDNPNGTAAGFLVETAPRQAVVVLPGPPRELLPMIDRHLLPYLEARGGLPVIAARRLRAIGLGESLLAERIAGWDEGLADVAIGYYPQDPGVDVKLTATGADEAAAEAALDAATRRRRDRIGEHVYFVEANGHDRTPLASVVGAELRDRGDTLAVAESCTGGLVASMITAVAGSSDYFRGGVVAYANAVKTAFVDVPEALLAAHGAVSEEVAAALADGARRHFGTTWAIGVTGVAGPGGGTEEKPVGLVWMAVAGPDGTRTHRTQHAGDRTTIQRRASATALDLLRRRLR
jgi:nicotinamide-nucleotide amidase